MSGKTLVWVELVCSECSHTEAGRFVSNGRIPIRSMKALAKSGGWVFREKDSYCSEKCAKDHRASRIGGEV